MSVSFKGIQNVGAIRLNALEDSFPSHAQRFLQSEGFDIKNFNVVSDRIVMQLTNKSTRDLATFKAIFKEFPDKIRKGFLRFDVVTLQEEEKDFIGEPRKLFFLNSKPVKMKDENLGLFSKVAGLLNRIGRTKEKITLSKHYPKSHDFFENLAIDFPNNQNPSVEKINLFRDLDNARKGAIKIVASLTESVKSYIN